MSNQDQRNQQIANTILRQMGGAGRLKAMVGAYHVYYIESGVQFMFKGSRKANKLVVILEPNDTYTMTFYKNSTQKATSIEKAKFEGVYFDQLIELFESTTGLYLHF